MIPVIAAGIARTIARGAAVSAAAPGRMLNSVWAVDSTWNLMERVAADFLPGFIHGCNVMVQGGPNADLRRIWFLTCAIGFGKMLRSPGHLGERNLNATWDISGKSCKLELVYRINTLATASMDGTFPNIGERLSDFFNRTRDRARAFFGFGMGGGFRPARVVPIANTKNSGPILIQQGPDQLTIGSGWPSFLRLATQDDTPIPGSGNDPIPGVSLRDQIEKVAPFIRVIETRESDQYPRNIIREFPNQQVVAGVLSPISVPHRFIILRSGNRTPNPNAVSPISAIASPTLPDDGRIITTGEKTHPGVQPVRPLLDGATRTSLVALFAQALQQPCYLPEAFPITNDPLFSRGLFLHDSGGGLDYNTVSQTATSTRADFNVNASGLDEDPAFPSDDFPEGATTPPLLPLQTTDYRG